MESTEGRDWSRENVLCVCLCGFIHVWMYLCLWEWAEIEAIFWIAVFNSERVGDKFHYAV